MALRALRRAAISYGQHAWPYRIGSDLRICTSSTSRCLSDIPGEDQEQQEQHKQGKQQKSKADGERVLLHGVHDLPAAPQGIVELREYQLQPASLKPYLQLLAEHAERRKQLSPLVGMFTCDTGGSLTSVLHLYHYRDLQHREEARAAAARDAAWQSDMIDAGRRTGIVYQTSSILRHVDYTNYQQAFPKKLPSAAASAAAPEAAFQPTSMRGRRPGGDSSGDIAAQKAAWVLSVRQLQPWGPNFAHRDLQVAAAGRNAQLLHTKHKADFVFAGWTSFGAQKIVELFRFPSTAALDACVMARGLGFALVPGYDPVPITRLLVPTPCSPWQ